MGNAPSADVHRRPTHKLSKPRTGSHATAGLLSPNGLSNSTARFPNYSRVIPRSLPLPPAPSPTSSTPSPAFEGFDAFEQPADPMVMVVNVQQKETKSWRLLRTLSSHGIPSKHRRRNSSVGRSPRISDKLSRANSMTFESSFGSYYGSQTPEHWPPAGSRLSWNYDMASYEAKRLLNVTEEPTFERDSVMSEARTEPVSEVTWKSSNPTHPQPASTTISRVNSDLSSYNTPVRRRSIIQKPGVATRAENPTPPVPSFRYSHPPTPSASRKQSFESIRGGVVSMPPQKMDPDAIPRVVTPCEAEYQSIGAFKLGSLRITNGAASPSSLETGRSREKGETSQNNSRERVDHLTETLSILGYHDSEPTDDKPYRPESPAKIQAPRPRTLDLGSIAKLFGGGSDKGKSDSGSVAKELSPRVAEPSPQYLAEMTFTPFSLLESRSGSPELKTTSKHTAVEDSLFEDDAQPEYSAAETLDVRLDLNARPPSAQVAGDLPASFKGMARTDSGFVSTASPSSEYSHRPLTKADSGYGSNVSLRSFSNSKQLALDKEFSQSLDKRLLSTKSKFSSSEGSESQPRSPVSTTSKDYPPSQPDRTAPPPPVPPKDFVPLSPTRINSASTGKSLSNNLRSKEARLSRHTPSPILSLRSSESAPKSPDSAAPKTPLSAKSDTSTSALSIGSGSNKPNKLQRLLSGARRSSHGPPTVHATHVTDKAAIPSIPRDVETKLREHTGLFPITTKRLALKTQLSRDTLKTIFSVGSLEHSLDAVHGGPSASTVNRVPSLSKTENKAMARKYALEDLPSPRSVAAAHLFPGKAITRKPVPTRHSSLKTKEREDPVDTESSTIDVNNVFDDNSRHAAFNALSEREGTYFSPKGPGRTMSLRSSSSDRHLETRRMPHKAKSSASLADVDLSTLPSPLLTKPLNLAPKANVAPPVSLMTRRPMSLRIPPPLRHRPAPADPNHQALSRKSSRENVQSYPPSTTPKLAHQSSRERIRSYPPGAPYGNDEESASPPPIPPQNPRRAMSLRSRASSTSQQVPPNWEVQSDNGMSSQPKRYSSDEGSRTNSFSSSQSNNGDWTYRPSTAKTEPPHRNQPQLRHRSSYDGSGRSYRRYNPPSMSNGYTAPAHYVNDPLSTLNYVPPPPQWDQYGRYPPVPRGHYRNRSIGAGYIPGGPPYRVLHSYNSPAYRNAPIWG